MSYGHAGALAARDRIREAATAAVIAGEPITANPYPEDDAYSQNVAWRVEWRKADCIHQGHPQDQCCEQHLRHLRNDARHSTAFCFQNGAPR